MRNSVIVKSGESDVYKVTEDIVILIVSITHPSADHPGPPEPHSSHVNIR